MRRRSAEANINAHVWEADSDPNHLHSCPLIMVAVEQAVGHRFQAFLTRLYVANELDRVVFDECHLAITAASYRSAMALLPKLRQLEVQMIFLTGTLPPDMVSEFKQKMLVRGRGWFVALLCAAIYLLALATALRTIILSVTLLFPDAKK